MRLKAVKSKGVVKSIPAMESALLGVLWPRFVASRQAHGPAGLTGGPQEAGSIAEGPKNGLERVGTINMPGGRPESLDRDFDGDLKQHCV
jgi:hypothetical protein